ncbi:MAG: phosphopentomutase [Actinobacteria bacterium]|nr:phosphopentomutase [Actinomycetota bacterium]
MRKKKRIILIVLDSVGVGELPDAHKYNDEGSNTLGNMAKVLGGLNLPNLEKMGLGNIISILGIEPQISPIANYGKMAEVSAGKESTIGHWEIMGLHLLKPFPTYPNGFPEEIMEKFHKAIGIKTLGNYPASGTEIIKILGDEHIQTKKPIVYTSADSVFQIAAHEDVISVEELYEICRKAREILTGEHSVGRVIARPFIGKSGKFIRTKRRKDFSLEPTEKTLLDYLKEKGGEVLAVGKIYDIFAGRGITKKFPTKSNIDGINKIINLIKKNIGDLIISNLIDFDMLYGHRNNPEGYAKALVEFDQNIPKIIDSMKYNDILFITADHGCDPTTPSTDHSREYVPLLVYGKDIKAGINLGKRKSFADVGKTISEILKVKVDIKGKSFAKQILL